jgi:hypothetical protein
MKTPSVTQACRLPTVAGRANPAALAGERDDKPLAAARAEGTAEPEAENAALEIAAEFLLDVARHRPLRLVTPLEPALKIPRHDLVERRLLGATTLVTAGGTTGPGGAAGSPGDESGGS